MTQKNEITIFSTFTKDKILSESEALIKEQEGGPAFYIKQAFEDEKINFVLKTSPKMNVQILITKNGEFGKVSKILKPKTIHFSQIKTPFLIISSVLNEFNLLELSNYQGRVFLDIQGYVRDGNSFGKKKLWKPKEGTFNNIFCLKGTREEWQNIPAQYFEIQKQKILIITDGKEGCEVFAFGKRYLVRPPKILALKNTIGAGDTFFAYFVSCLIKTESPLYSAKYATKKTSTFLDKTHFSKDSKMWYTNFSENP
jgi:hypothetical protein